MVIFFLLNRKISVRASYSGSIFRTILIQNLQNLKFECPNKLAIAITLVLLCWV
jgi:hypothetical protein